MEIVAEMPDTRVEGFLAAGHAATITGWGIFEPFVAAPRVCRSSSPASSRSTFSRRSSGSSSSCAIAQPAVVNMFPRCVTRDGNANALKQLWHGVPDRSAAGGAASRTCRTATCGCATSGPRSTRAGDSRSTSRRCGSTRRRRWCASASAETSWPASRRRPTARCSATRACRMRRSARAWSAAKARAASGTSTAACRGSEVRHVQC